MNRLFLTITVAFFALPWALLLPCSSGFAQGAPDRKTVVLDPGHGGQDTGATAGATAEKNLSLELARKIRASLLPYFHVVLTRDKDLLLSPGERAGISNHRTADCFVSLHFSPRAGHGRVEVFSWSTTAPPEDKPPSAHGLRAWDKLQKPHSEPSQNLGAVLKAELKKEFPAAPSVRGTAPLAVLAGVDCPAVAVDFPMGLFRGRDAKAEMNRAARAISQAVLAFLKRPQP